MAARLARAGKLREIHGDPEEFRERSQSALPSYLRTDDQARMLRGIYGDPAEFCEGSQSMVPSRLQIDASAP